MRSEDIREFTMRISQSNRTSLLVIVYDIFLQYIADAFEELKVGNKEGYVENLSKAKPVLSELIGALDFDFDIANVLLNVYRRALRNITMAQFKADPEILSDSIREIKMIRDEFEIISQRDNSEPLMENTEKVYSGLTYGPGFVYDTVAVAGAPRGYRI